MFTFSGFSGIINPSITNQQINSVVSVLIIHVKMFVNIHLASKTNQFSGSFDVND